MKQLKDILYKTKIVEVIGSTALTIEKVCFDSREVAQGRLFIAAKGTQVDGHHYIEQAVEKGAVAIVCEELPEETNKKVTYIKVKNSSTALGIIASNFYNNPSEKLKLIGITGTNGKTTTATLLYELFKILGYKTGLISTISNKITQHSTFNTQPFYKTQGRHSTFQYTTPDAIQLNALLKEMVESGCTHCFMEVSSHAIVQNRIAGLAFTGGVFTNITHDHLDYHKTFDQYIKAKKSFFDTLNKNAFALVNKDDSHGAIMLQNCDASHKTYALQSMADFRCKIIENQFSGLQLNINGKDVWTKLIGRFNAYNLLAVYAAATLLGEEELDVLTAISQLASVEGRAQYFKTENNITAIVDYAHTPDALKNVLHTIKELRTGNEQVITVVGCGGNRDKEKRPLMAKIACKHSNKVILTSDNPRTEEPEAIISDMQKGIEPAEQNKTLSITNRKEAIKTACSLANNGDIILVAGKGHEKHQEIKGKRIPFDDVEVLKDILGVAVGSGSRQ